MPGFNPGVNSIAALRRSSIVAASLTQAQPPQVLPAPAGAPWRPGVRGMIPHRPGRDAADIHRAPAIWVPLRAKLRSPAIPAGIRHGVGKSLSKRPPD